MKSSDMKLNAEYLSNPRAGWETYTYVGTGYSHDTKRVRLLDTVTRHWERDDQNGFKISGYSSYRTTRGLLVAVLDPESGEFHSNMVVTAQSIRGPWESTWALVQENARRVREDAEERRLAREEASQAMQDVIDRIQGSVGFLDGLYLYDTNRAIIYLSALERIADRLEGR